MRLHRKLLGTVAPMIVLVILALGTTAAAQENLFNITSADREDAPMTPEQKAAGEKESIFCNTMKTGQMCTHGTAAILGLKGADAEEWTTWARKYNKAVNEATEQLFKDASTKLTPRQMELLKAWFAVGWNTQMNALLYGKDLDNLEKADLESVKKMNPRPNRP